MIHTVETWDYVHFLSKLCTNEEAQQEGDHGEKHTDGLFDWNIMTMGYGCGTIKFWNLSDLKEKKKKKMSELELTFIIIGL